MTSPSSGGSIEEPPLTLYVHIPWCVRKCPYCDFNSHALGDRRPPFGRYVTRLLEDLDWELRSPAARRSLKAIFIGGGTPSLLPGKDIRRLIDGVRERLVFDPVIEITLEANPGAADVNHFAAYRAAGVNRLSIGVQSLSAPHLVRLGRIHDPAHARAAVSMARAAGFENLNLDLMFALPGQHLDEAREDLDALIELAPEHISYYQLTLEPNTRFHLHPPELPDFDLAAEMAAFGVERLAEAGYERYEVSAYAREGRRCRHNLNYWRFGDYLGIGAGAHGKLTERDGDMPWRILRTAKQPRPDPYLEADPTSLVSSRRTLSELDRLFEFALNAMRLTEGFEPRLFAESTGLPWSRIAPFLEAAAGDGLLLLDEQRIKPTPLGRDFLDDLVARFMPPEI